MRIITLLCLFILAPLALSAPPSLQSDYDNLEAVFDTSLGQIVIEFFPKEAPRHVEYFVKQAREGAYDGTTFHRLLKYGLVQGGDPLSKNPALRARYGTGGLGVGLPDEVNGRKHTTGAISAVLSEDRSSPKGVKAGSSGAQFFIVLKPQPALDTTFTVFARVVQGMDTVTNISEAAASPGYIAKDRIEIKKVTIREKTPTLEQMRSMTALIETSLGNIKLQLTPDGAPNTARMFVRYAKAGLYDGTTFSRISQKYYMLGGSPEDWPAEHPNRKRFFSVWPVPFEKTDTKHLRGIASMLQVDGATTLYFFLISKDNPKLDGQNVPFAKVVEGLDVVDKLAEAEVEGDKPKQRLEIKKITLQ